MSIYTTRVIGLVSEPLLEKYKAAYDACKAVGVEPPDDVKIYLDNATKSRGDDTAGSDAVPTLDVFHELRNCSAGNGYEVDVLEALREIPELTHIRFVKPR